MNNPKFIRLFRMSNVLDRQILNINRKLCKTSSNSVVISLTKRYDSLVRRREIVNLHKSKL